MFFTEVDKWKEERERKRKKEKEGKKEGGIKRREGRRTSVHVHNCSKEIIRSLHKIS